MFLCTFFFFFQAEDGIRDADVTGVQTCALPISRRGSRPAPSLPLNGPAFLPLTHHESRARPGRSPRPRKPTSGGIGPAVRERAEAMPNPIDWVLRRAEGAQPRPAIPAFPAAVTQKFG